MNDHEPAWVHDVLQYWFEALPEAAWFKRDAAVDDLIRQRFLPLHAHVTADGGVSLASAPRTLLAAVLVLDQFSRNLYRDDPRSYEADADARHVARSMIEQGLDRALTPQQRLFVYLPFVHSENADDQALAVRLVATLDHEEWTRSALAHQSTIARFGRFPMRNVALGRGATADEAAFITDGTQA